MSSPIPKTLSFQHVINLKKLRYFKFFLHTESLEASVYLTLQAQLNQTGHTASAQKPCVASGCHIGPHSSRV